VASIAKEEWIVSYVKMDSFGDVEWHEYPPFDTEDMAQRYYDQVEEVYRTTLLQKRTYTTLRSGDERS